MDFQTLHQRAIEIAGRFHRAESELIEILQQIDENRVFGHFGFASLFDYATKALKLSEANASGFIAVARKSKSVPELKEAIVSGKITVSKARRLTPIINKENSSEWIELAASVPKAKLEIEIAKLNPQLKVQEKIKPVASDRFDVKFGLSEADAEKLKRAQDIVCQKTRKAASIEETVIALLNFYLHRQDPVVKAERILQKKLNKADADASGPGHVQ